MIMSKVKFFSYDKTGDIVFKVKDGGGVLSIDGQELTAIDANSRDAAKEKHVPDITREDGKIKVQIGSVLHPSLQEHYIEWIALATEDRFEVAYLKPGAEPRAEFADAESGVIYEYCNLHGLWKAEF
jgi:superoxide reductase